MEIQERSRRPRFRRHRFGKPPLVLQDRDAEIVRLVADYRFVTSEEIQALVSGSDQTILRRLQKLFHGGYLDRPRNQRQRGNEKMVYALGQKGAELLARLANAGSVGKVDWLEKNRQVRVQYLEHALMVSRFRTTLTLATSSRSDVVVESWGQGNDLRDSVVVEGEHGSERIPVAPDAYLVLRLVNEPAGGNRIHIFLEADRGTMTTKRFLTKVRGYWHYWQSGTQEKRFGMKNFLVLTITLSDERAGNLCSATKALDDVGGLRMFLFGSERNYVEGQTRRILDAVWQSPADDALHGLLE